MKGLIVCGVLNVSLAGAWFVAVRLTIGAPPHVEPDQPYYAEPTSGVYHADKDCPYLKGKETVCIPHRAAAAHYGVPCARCVTSTAQPRIASARSPR